MRFSTMFGLNFRPESRENWRIGVPLAGTWQEILNSDKNDYGGSGKENPSPLHTAAEPVHGMAQSLTITVPPLGGTLIKYTGETK